jgi:hypothetical protein
MNMEQIAMMVIAVFFCGAGVLLIASGVAMAYQAIIHGGF